MNRSIDPNSASIRHLAALHARYDADAGVILVQVDQLARINHSAGTETGNALLEEVGRRLENFAGDEFGPGAVVGRLTGPRFVIVPALPLSLAALHAQERALHVALAEPLVGDPSGRVAIRIAAALITRDEPIADQLRIASDQLARPASARDGAMVKAALAHGEVAIFYQPQYDVASGAMVGVEALLRWRHPELGLLGAGPLVTAARAARMERELTEHAHRLALTEIAGWPKALAGLRISLNITAADLGDPDFADRFAAMARQAKVDPDRLTLELTEQAMLSDPASAAAQLSQIRALGSAIAIDDFGTGYSSLSLLARLPIDYLKIDSGFTRSIDGSDRDRIVVRAIVDLARALGLLVVAEGVENEGQLARLGEIGVAMWQGFLKSGPVPGEELVDLLGA
ncbi:GGDEF domain-containing phosphodiesterase [Sphingopyxis flava]|uniref:EAL domain, c-di-GMP-specific phosphodiesterase class I (Or its enzymatically inactive variant) n=1 Tax=Sphingopyxis flava TaxID=1507287 RepID=A0A1T5CR29_9SPHN|nr:GGDEF domain-containing phosphodiesterase [Sphingopyxis flava]SKB61899.1 EAL domain, c-di-GMP-specific phosphodiesterase class I (or its enzymatically inactive variant) [Sphingopyxis flava]